MPVKIGHASIDERGRGTGGVAGDQTGREVYIKDFYIYKGGWDAVLRPVKSAIAEKSAQACEAGCYNNNVGYDMNQRNTFHTEAKKVGYNLAKVKTKCETDCSAFMTLCAIAGGVSRLEYTLNAPTTATMCSVFTATGEYKMLTDRKYLDTDQYLRRGDILVKKGHHTVMVLTNGIKATTAKDVVNTVKNTVGKVVADTSNKKFYGKCSSAQKSIITGLASVGERDTSFSHRKKIAIANGIKDYTGNAAQNTTLLNYLKKGKLAKA